MGVQLLDRVSQSTDERKNMRCLNSRYVNVKVAGPLLTRYKCNLRPNLGDISSGDGTLAHLCLCRQVKVYRL